MGTAGAGICGQFQRSFGPLAPSCSLCSGPAVCRAHRACGVTSGEGTEGRAGAPWLQGLDTTGALVKSKAEAEGQEKAPGKELQPLGLLLCTFSAFFVIMVVIKTSSSPRQALSIAQPG